MILRNQREKTLFNSKAKILKRLSIRRRESEVMEKREKKPKIGRIISSKVLKPKSKIGRIISHRRKGKG
jgi:hypothetical protein